MHVQVHHGLPAVLVAIDDEPEPGVRDLLRLRDRGGRAQEPAGERLVGGFDIDDRRDVLPRNHEDVRRRLRVDVAEGDDLVVRKDGSCGDFPGDDAAEEAIHGLARRRLRRTTWRRTLGSVWRGPRRTIPALLGTWVARRTASPTAAIAA